MSKILTAESEICLYYFSGNNLFAYSKRSLEKQANLKQIRVARVVNFYGLVFLKFGNVNKFMQNPIPKLRQSSIISKKPGF